MRIQILVSQPGTHPRSCVPGCVSQSEKHNADTKAVGSKLGLSSWRMLLGCTTTKKKVRPPHPEPCLHPPCLLLYNSVQTVIPLLPMLWTNHPWLISSIINELQV